MSDDLEGYENHKRRRAILVPLGIAFVIGSFGVASLLMMLPAIKTGDAKVLATALDKIVLSETDDYLDYSFSDSHIMASVAFIGMLAIAIVILSYAHTDRINYFEAFDHLDFTYPPETVRRYKQIRRKYVGWGAFCCGVGLAAAIVLSLFKLKHLGVGCGFISGAIGIALIIHGGMVAKSTDIYAYNFEALKETSIYSIRSGATGPERDIVLAAKVLSMKAQSANRVIITAGAIGSFCLYFLPSFETSFYWVPLALAFIAAIIVNHEAMEHSRKDFEHVTPTGERDESAS